jgi:RNA polymerase sigma-70 factor (ECF subfamily)
MEGNALVHEDIDLVERSLRGERDAFEALVRKYQDAVYGLAFHLTDNFADAQDIAQQAFVTAYLKLAQLKDPGRFISWLRRITVNECISWSRQQERFLRLRGRIENHDNPVPTPHQEYEEKEINAAVRKAMESLSEKNRLAMTLYYIDGLSQREVGSFLGIPTSTVGNRISRARKQLKEEMIKMVEDTFKEHRLPQNFTKRVEETLDKAQEAKVGGNLGKASDYSDEALEVLASVPESPEARKLRKRALWLKGDIVYFPLGAQETLKYHEQALELEEKGESKRGYAEALMRLSHGYSDVDQKEKANEYKQKALKIYEEIGDLDGQAEIWMWMGGDVFFTEPEKALPRFQKAIDLYSQTEKKSRGYESVCRAAIALIEEMGKLPGIDKFISYGAVSEVLERSSSRLDRISEPGFGWNKKSYDWEKALGNGIIHLLQDGGRILDYGSKVGESWTMEAFSYTFKPLRATRSVESYSETVSVVAGDFSDCLKLRTVITPSPDDDGPERKRELNRINCGTKQAWFAPGVGPVKLIFDREDGVHVDMELAEYTVRNGGGDYFPLSIGNRWIYHSHCAHEGYITRDCCEVAARSGDVYYIDNYAYVYFAGTEEKYKSLGE